VTTKPTEAQEREAFKAWFTGDSRGDLQTNEFGTYALNNMWNGWQARAALAATPAYAPKFDEAEFAKLTANGTKAWADVPDPAAWVADLRGAAPPAPVAQPLSDEQISRAGRCLADRAAWASEIDKDDYIEDARAALNVAYGIKGEVKS
jgi:hypothetical protein